MIQDFEARFAALCEDENSMPLDIKDAEKRNKDMLRLVATTSARSSERQELERQKEERRRREAATLAEQIAADPLAEEDADPAAQQEKLEEIKRKVEKELVDVDDLGEEPDTYTTVLRPPQALPALELNNLDIVQQALTTAQLVTEDSSSSSSSSKALEAAFTWLLRGTFDQLLTCPDAEVAKATFQTVCFGSRELSFAAYNRFLAWCGMSESQRGFPGKDVTEEAWVTQLDSSKPGLAGILCRSEQAEQQQPTIAWLPSAGDFVSALTALGCGTAAAAAAADTTRGASSKRSSTPAAKQQQQGGDMCAPVANLKLLLQLLAHTCRLQTGEAARLPYSLGSGVQGAAACRQLAVLLMSLMLDRQLAAANCGHVLSEALGSLIAVVSPTEWVRVERQLLEVLNQGLGPSNRSLFLVLTKLPQSARGASLRQLAALQLVRKMTTHGKKQAAAAAPLAFSTPREVHMELVKLLGKSPTRELMSSFTTTDKDGQQQQDTWALMDLLEATHLVLWTDMLRTGGGVGDEFINWFINWTEKLEQRSLAKNLTSHRVRNTLTERANAYRFWGKTILSSGAGTGDDDMIDCEDD